LQGWVVALFLAITYGGLEIFFPKKEITGLGGIPISPVGKLPCPPEICGPPLRKLTYANASVFRFEPLRSALDTREQIDELNANHGRAEKEGFAGLPRY
jgi:hypothetical protein